MTSDDYRKQLAAIGDAAAAEVDQCHRAMRRIATALARQRERVARLRASAESARGYYRVDYQAKADMIESVIEVIERAME